MKTKREPEGRVWHDLIGPGAVERHNKRITNIHLAAYVHNALLKYEILPE